MTPDPIEPIVLDIDTSRVEEGTTRANRAIDAYGETADKVSQRVKANWERQSEQTARLAGQNQDAFDKMVDHVERYGAGIERMGRSVEGAFQGLARVTRGAVEFGAALAVATKAVVTHREAVSQLESALTKIRGLRIGGALLEGGFTGGVGGALAGGAVVGTEIAAVIALERAGASTYQRAVQIQNTALRARLNGMDYGDAETLNFVSKRFGVGANYFNAGVAEAGGVGELGEKLRQLASVADPVQRADQAVATFGADAAKYLPFIGDRFAENAERVKDWGLQTDETFRKNVDAFRRDMDAVVGIFHSSEDAVAAWSEKVKTRIQDVFSGAYVGARRGASALGEMLHDATPGPGTVFGTLFPGLNLGSLSPGSIDVLGRVGYLAPGPGIADAERQLRGADSAAALRSFRQANLDEQQQRLQTAVTQLQQSLFYHDPRKSNFGQLVSGNDFILGYNKDSNGNPIPAVGGDALRDMAVQQLISDQATLGQIPVQQASRAGTLAGGPALGAAQAKLEEIRQKYSDALNLGAPQKDIENAYRGQLEVVRKIEHGPDVLREIAAIGNDLGSRESLLPQSTRVLALLGSLSPDDLRKGMPAAFDVLNRESLDVRDKFYDEFEKSAAKSSLKPIDLLGQGQGLKQQQESVLARIGLAPGIRESYIAAQRAQMSYSEAQELGGAELAGIGSQDSTQNQRRILEIKKKYADEGLAYELELAREKHLNDGQLENVTKDLRIKNAHEVFDLELGLAKALAEEKKRQTDTISREAEPLFHTLLTKPLAFPKQFRNTLHEAIVRPISEGLSNMTGEALRPLIYGSDGQGGVASMFHFGKSHNDSPVVSTDRNTKATEDNTDAISRLNDRLSGAVSQTLSGASAPGSATYGGFSLRSARLGGLVPGGGGGGMFGVGPSVASMLAPFMAPGVMMGRGWDGASAAPYGAPPGVVSSSIDYGDGAVDLGSSYYGVSAPGYSMASLPRSLGGGSAAALARMATTAASTRFWSPPSTFPNVWNGFGTEGSNTLPSGVPLGSSGVGGLSRGPSSSPRFNLGGFAKFGTNLKDAFWSPPKQFPNVWNGAGTEGSDTLPSGVPLGSSGVGGLSGPGGITGALGSPGATAIESGAGSMLAEAGLFGNRRGTWGGIAESTAGGAMIGLAVGGPLGAAIGAGVGFAVGGIEDLAGLQSAPQKAKNYVQQIYHISISNQEASQIAQIAQSQFGGNVAVAVRSPQVRQMLGLYAAGTGQSKNFPLSATTPEAGSLVEQNGKLFQGANYQYGNAYAYASNLPVMGGPVQGTYPSSGPTYMSINVNGGSMSDYMNANVFTPETTMANYSAAMSSSDQRTWNSAAVQAPGLIVS